MPYQRPSSLRRLSPEHYRGEAWVHWILTIKARETGWLDGRFLYRFREILTHVTFRYQLACTIFCLMPDHIHMLWTGLTNDSEQLVAMKRFRKDTNESLRRIGFELQKQAYDHVLKDSEIERTAIEDTSNYIAKNPERARLVAPDEFDKYPYTGCLLPGGPQLRPFGEDGWNEVWRTLEFLKRTKCYRVPDPKYPST